MKLKLSLTVCAATLAATGSVLAQSASPVTVDNFIRAESDTYIGNFAKESGGLAKLVHRREPASIDNQTVIRLNRDTLYSSAVFDLDAGPVTVTMPDPGKRFMSLMSVSQDHYATTVYGKGAHTFTRDKVGTRYVMIGDPHLCRSERSGGREEGPRVAGRDQGQPEEHRQARIADLGSCKPEEGPRRAAGSGLDRHAASTGRSAPRPRSIRSVT